LELYADCATFKGEDYDCLVLPGGRGPEYIRLNPRVIELVRHFAHADKPIAAICHAAQILTAANVVKGKKLNGYPACRPDIEIAGGTYITVPMTEAVVDGNLVTGPAWPAHPAFLAKFNEVLQNYLKHAHAPATAGAAR
jgi:protease I